MAETLTTKNLRAAALPLGYQMQRLEVLGARGVPDLLVQPPGAGRMANGLLCPGPGAGLIEAKYEAPDAVTADGLKLSKLRPEQAAWLKLWVVHRTAWASLVCSVGEGPRARWYVWRARPTIAWALAVKTRGVDRWACAACVGARPSAMLLAVASARHDDPRFALPPLPA